MDFKKIVKNFLWCDCKHFEDKLINKNIAKTFEEWKKISQNNFEINKQKYLNYVVSCVDKLNQPARENKYIENENNYIIEAHNVNKWFVNKKTHQFNRVLDNINLKIKQGEIVIILGESGSGKTTLLNIFSGMDRPTSGKIIVANNNLTSLNQRELTNFRKKYISIIFQNYSLIPELNVRENIEFGDELQEDARKKLDIDVIAEELLIKEKLNKFPKQLSGGQQQRTSIAKAVIKNTKILFADEPTGAVDTDTCKRILQIFWNINQKYKTTIILITHNRTIIPMAHKVIKIKNGSISSIINQTPKPISSMNFHQDKVSYE